jgi:hypothetical protein
LGHLVAPIHDTSLADCANRIERVREYLARAVATWLPDLPNGLSGIELKRRSVLLSELPRPALIEKDSERFGELVNMLATLERLLGALTWFGAQTGLSAYTVGVCHPTTSTAPGLNDLVLVDQHGRTAVRCEVCDVVAFAAGQNSKEKKDLASLGCRDEVPMDGTRRFICTSEEFAAGLRSSRRRWKHKAHRYEVHAVGDSVRTHMLEILSGC